MLLLALRLGIEPSEVGFGVEPAPSARNMWQLRMPAGGSPTKPSLYGKWLNRSWDSRIRTYTIIANAQGNSLLDSRLSNIP